MPHLCAFLGVGGVVLALVFQGVSIGTTHWQGKDSNYTRGIWEECEKIPLTNFTVCEDISPVESWLMAVRAFCIIAMVVMACNMVCFYFMITRSEISIIQLFTTLTAAYSGISSFLAFAVYTTYTRGGIMNYGYSYYLTVVASGLCELASVLFMIAAASWRSSYTRLD